MVSYLRFCILTMCFQILLAIDKNNVFSKLSKSTDLKGTLGNLGTSVKDALKLLKSNNANSVNDANLKSDISIPSGEAILTDFLQGDEIKELLKKNNLGSLANDDSIMALAEEFLPLMGVDINLKGGGYKTKGDKKLKNALMSKNIGSLESISKALEIELQLRMTEPNFQNQCKKDILYTVRHYKEKWVQRMVDSYGKPTSGIMTGSTNFYGSYSECLSVNVPQQGQETLGFKGKSCWAVWIAPKMEYGNLLTSTICVPSSCKSQDVVDLHPIIKGILDQQIPIWSEKRHSLKFAMSNCQTDPGPLTTPGYVFRLLIVTIVGAVLICTILDRFYLYDTHRDTLPLTNHTTSGTMDEKNSERTQEKCGLQRWVLCFSAYENVKTLLKIETTNQQTDFFHGIRVFCLTWVIIGHVSMNVLPVGENLEFIPSVVKTFHGQFVLQGFYAVDTFFVISGFFLTYIFMSNATRKIGMKIWLMFYLHRYIRLTPSFLIIRLWAQTHWFSLNDGPIWFSVNNLIKECSNTWPQALVYLGNFGDVSTNCLSWTWYLANDFQFFALSPPFLICLKRFPKQTLFIMLLIVLSSSALTAYISHKYKLYIMQKYMSDYLYDSIGTSKKLMEMTDVMYEKPYCRIGPYFIGMLLGYFYYITKNKTVVITRVKQTFLWTLSIATMMVIIFGPLGREITLQLSLVYHSFGRIGWALAICWPIYACLKGYGGFLNTLLSWKLLQPVSRLSYCIYLLHPILMHTYYYSLQKPLTISNLSMALLIIAVLCTTTCMAFVFSVLIEAPFIKVEKQIRSM